MTYKEKSQFYINLLPGKLKEFNDLVGGDFFWIDQDIAGDKAEFCLANPHCNFSGWCSPEELVGFLKGMITATKLGYRKNIIEDYLRGLKKHKKK